MWFCCVLLLLLLLFEGVGLGLYFFYFLFFGVFVVLFLKCNISTGKETKEILGPEAQSDEVGCTGICLFICFPYSYSLSATASAMRTKGDITLVLLGEYNYRPVGCVLN